MRRAPIVTAATAGLLALGGAAYAGSTGEPRPDEQCTATQAGNLVSVGGVCPNTNVDPLVNLPVIGNL